MYIVAIKTDPDRLSLKLFAGSTLFSMQPMNHEIGQAGKNVFSYYRIRTYLKDFKLLCTRGVSCLFEQI